MTVKPILWTHKQRKDGTHAIKIYVNHNGKVKYYPVGLHVHKSQWNEKKGEVRSSLALSSHYNARIFDIRNELEAHFLKGGSHDSYENPTRSNRNSILRFLESFLGEIKSGQVGLKLNTANSYQSVLTRLKNYINYKGKNDLYFDEIDLDFYYDYCHFLGITTCNTPGIGSQIKTLKAIMNKALERGLHDNTAHQKRAFKTVKPQTSKIFLNQEEVGLLKNIDLSDAPELERERDRWLIAYYFLLRFSDVCRLNQRMFFKKGDRLFLRIGAQKTGNEAIIPVKPIALALLEKYAYKLDFTANQVANRNIKLVASLAGINDMIFQDGKRLPKCKFVTMHTARRSAATNLYLEGLSLKTIGDLGGWKSVSNLMIYLRASGMDSADMAADLDFFK